MMSKSLLRHPEARSTLDEMLPGTGFRRYIPDTGEDIDKPEDIKRIILCTGQVYYALTKYRRDNNIKNVAISRIEQIAPVSSSRCWYRDPARLNTEFGILPSHF